MQQRSRVAAAMKTQQIHLHVYCDDQQVARAALVICGLWYLSLFLKMVWQYIFKYKDLDLRKATAGLNSSHFGR